MGPIRNPRWEQKRTEGYVIVSTEPLVFMFNGLRREVIANFIDIGRMVDNLSLNYLFIS